ncbi:hypothetical protein [Uliginosibacterium gangwonense]|uniref:hypothetical protein n=1 Tax=Uliginosibacterium gangwonense TaxID=392736 RepID=UPI0003606A5D|nr:hypothetical protein [Uliginosibacterium gangwonense]
MSLFIPAVGENKLLALMLGAGNQQLHFYTNDITPADADTAASYTEANFSGYAAKTLTGSSWTIAQNANAVAEAAYAELSWTNAGSSQVIYGYYVTDATSGVLLWAERFSASVTVMSGDVIKLTPKITLSKV